VQTLLKPAQGLEEFWLGLRGTPVDDEMVSTIFHDFPVGKLRVFKLWVNDTACGDATCQAVGSLLGKAKVLKTVDIDIDESRCSQEGLAALSRSVANKAVNFKVNDRKVEVGGAPTDPNPAQPNRVAQVQEAELEGIELRPAQREAQQPRDEQHAANEQQAFGEVNPMKLIPANLWGITGHQLMELADEVMKKCTGANENPNVYQVVELIIKPACASRNVSYAILKNPKGKKCDTFVSHAWFESFLGFVEDIRKFYKDFDTRVFWICFAANPQTWLKEELTLLLGPSALQSPFYIALQQCQTFLVVRNTARNLYTRLWCVTELALVKAYTTNTVHVIGKMPPFAKESGSDIGLNATCSAPEDVALLQQTIRVAGVDVNELVAQAIRARSGSSLASGNTTACKCACQ